MDKLLVYVLYHNQDQLNNFEKQNFLIPIDLNQISDEQHLAEGRFFTSNFAPSSEYIGVASANWNNKYSFKLENLNTIDLKEHCIYFPDTTTMFWVLESEVIHKGMIHILQDICVKFDLSLNGISFWANNFVCHKNSFVPFIKFWNEAMNYIIDKYGIYPPYHVCEKNKHRHLAYLGERITTLYFANQKLDLIPLCNEIRRLPLESLIL